MQSAEDHISAGLRILGGLFYHAPNTPNLAGVRAYLSHPAWIDEWPLAEANDLSGIAQDFSRESDEFIGQAFERLFVGPELLPAPLWGSVYLDEEGLLFGESTQALIAFYNEHGISLQTGMNEPPDHIALLFWMLALLIDKNREDLARIVLSAHLLPWSDRFFALFQEASEGSYFYSAAGRLAERSIKALANRWGVLGLKLRLYR